MSSKGVQLKTLLWQKFLRRWRSATVMLLEVVWPVVLFSVVIAIRQGSLPERRPQCFYPPRSMPSAGALEFIQTHVCSVNNVCLKESLYKYKGRPEGLGGAANRVKPEQHFASPLKLNVPEGSAEILPIVPKILNLLQNVQTAVAEPEVKAFLSDNGVKVESFVKNRTTLSRFLVDTGFVPANLIDPIMDAGLALSGSSQSGVSSFVDVKEVLCDPTKLGELIVLPDIYNNNNTKGRLSGELCAANHSQIAELVDLLTTQVKTEDLTNTIMDGVIALTTYQAENAVKDIALATKTVTSLQIFEPLVEVLPIIGSIGDIIEDIRDIVTNSGKAKGFKGVVELVAPLIGSLLSDKEFGDNMILFARGADGIIEFIKKTTSSATFSLKDVVPGRTSLQSSLYRLNGVDRTQIDRALNSQVSAARVRSMSDVLRLNFEWYKITCQTPNLTSVFKPTDDVEVQQAQAYLQAQICELGEQEATSRFSTLLDYTRMLEEMDRLQKARNVGVFDFFSLVSDVSGVTSSSIAITRKVGDIIRNWSNSTSGLGRRINEALNIKFVVDGEVKYGASEILDIIYNIVRKTEEFENLASAIHLARQIVFTAENDFVEVKGILKDPLGLVAVLIGNDLTQDLIDRILGSRVNLTGLLESIGGEGLTEGLCQSGKVLNALGLINDIGLSGDKLQDALCKDTDIGEFIDLNKLISEQIFSRIPSYMLYGDWWTDTLSDVNGVIDGIGALIDLIAGRRIFDARVLLKVLYHFIDSLGMGGRQDLMSTVPSLASLVRDRVKEPPYFLDDMEKLSRGLLSLSIFQRTIPLKGNIREYTKQPEVIKDFLRENISLSLYVSNVLLQSGYQQNLSYNIKDIMFTGENICGPGIIRSFLKLPDTSDEELSKLTDILCSLNGDQIKQFVAGVVPQLDLKDLVRTGLELSPTYLLSSSNLTKDETMKFVRQIGPIGSQFGSFLTSVKGVTDDMTDTGSGSTLRKYGRIVCNDSEAFNFGLYGASVLTSGPDEGTAEPTWTEEQLKEISEFKDPLCVSLYTAINTLSGVGPVLWRFLEPLTRGKILYTPKNTATDKIMNEAYWLFSRLDDVTEVARTLVKFTETNGNTSSNATADSIAELVDILKIPIVSSTIKNTAGVSGEELASNLGSTNQVTSADIMKLSELASTLISIINCLDFALEGYDDMYALQTRADELGEVDQLFAAVIFTNIKEDRKKRATDGKLDLPKHVKYILRVSQDHVTIPDDDSLFSKVAQAGPNDDFLDDLRYLWGFVVMQDLIEHAIIKLQMETKGTQALLPKIHTQAFPYPCYDQDEFMVWSSFVVVIILLFAWLCMMAVGITSAVSEKETGIEDTMLVMGMNGGVNRFAWFTNTLLGMILLSAFITALIRGGNIVRHSDPILIFLWLSTYSVSIVMLCYLVSALVHRSNLASLCGLLVYLLLCIPFIILHSLKIVFTLSFKGKLLMSLSVTSAFCFGANELIVTEKNGHGITWSNAFVPINRTFPFAWSVIMSVVDSVFYGLVAWYIANKFPGEHGLPQPWYFPVSPYYWGIKKRKAHDMDPQSKNLATTEASRDMTEQMTWQKGHGMRGTARRLAANRSSVVPGEAEPENLRVGISILKLTKVYNQAAKFKFLSGISNKCTGQKKLKAVDELSVNFFEGQITAFLGHNGAGKSTCIHMLTGLTQPTSGTAYIGGYNIKDGFGEIRKTLGYCPQHDVLFDYMTIEEHFKFYAQIKGSGTTQETNEEVQDMLRLTDLYKFKNIPVSHLSGGQRRRVSVGNAFIGGSKVIILDEPTSGVDPAARRKIWDIIAKHKKGRTVLLCTHHLDEADILGDRIVIVHQGRLICSGSSLWLKSQYGSGYHLTISKETKSRHREYRIGNGKFSTSEVLKFVKRFVPGAKLVEDIGTEVTIVLPTNRGQTTLFQKLFEHLEGRARDFYIDKYGIADSTLEEVFLKVTKSAEEGRSLDPDRLKAWVFKGGNSDDSMSILSGEGTHLSGPTSRFGSWTSGRHSNIYGSWHSSRHGSTHGSRHGTRHHGHRRHTSRHGSRHGTSSEHHDNLGFNDSDVESGRGRSRDRGRDRDRDRDSLSSEDEIYNRIRGVRRSNTNSSSHYKQGREHSSGYDTNPDSDIYNSLSDTSGRSMKDVKLVDAEDGKLTGRDRSQGFSLKRRQFKALLTKRFHHNRRDLRAHISQILLPSGFVCLAMIGAFFKPPKIPLQPYRLDTSIYGPDQEIIFSMFNNSYLAGNMTDTMKEWPGPGTLCMPIEERFNEVQWKQLYEDRFKTCSLRSYKPSFITPVVPADKLAAYERYPNCSCNSGAWLCPEEAAGPPRPTLRTHFKDNIINLTGYPLGIEEYLLRTYDVFKNTEVGEKYGGWTFDNEGTRAAATVWYNNKGVHSLPAFYNGLNNMVLRANIKMATSEDAGGYGITVYNQPYNTSSYPISTGALLMSVADTGASLTIMIAYCFVPASYIIYIINERIRQEKRLQFLTGVGVALYWFSAFLWDLVTYAVTVAITIGIARAFNLHVYNYGENLQALTVVLMLFGWAMIPQMYLLSRWFTTPTTGYVAAFIINLCVGINTTACVYFIQNPVFNNRPELVMARTILTKGLLIFPQFCLGDSLVKLAYNQIITDIMNLFNVDFYISPFSPSLLFYHFVVLGIEGVVFFVIHLVVEFNLCDGTQKVNRMPTYKEDGDVSRERLRVNEGAAEKDLLILYNLSKLYNRRGGTTTLAVDNLCLGVPRGECFGLLGINGAGKTTSFKMITGEIRPSGGAAILMGQIISEDMSSIQQNVGYCPQFDALDDFLTGEEMVYYYSRLRGLMEEDIPGICQRVVKKFQLERHIKKRVGAYSAGNKRKLSTAIALIGDPDLVLLDEPTTGMDPGTRRLVWDNIIDVIKDKRSVILTSHSMEECDALCTRMAIMVNGNFQCMGSGQHLKDKFGSGYTITIRVSGNNDDVRQVIRFMKNNFRGAWLKDRHLNMVEFGLKSSTLASIFRRVEREKARLKIENYSVVQTTLDQVFLHFANKQNDNRKSQMDPYDHISQNEDMMEKAEDDIISEDLPTSTTGTREPSTVIESELPPPYQSRRPSIAPNGYENRHMANTLDHVSQVHVPRSVSDVIPASSTTGSGIDYEIDLSVVGSSSEPGVSSSGSGALGGVESSSSGSVRGSLASRR